MKAKIIQDTYSKKIVEFTIDSKWKILKTSGSNMKPFYNYIDEKGNLLTVRKFSRFEDVIPFRNGVGAILLVKGLEYHGSWIVIDEQGHNLCDCSYHKPRHIADVDNDKMLAFNRREFVVINKDGVVATLKTKEEVKKYLNSLTWPKTEDRTM